MQVIVTPASRHSSTPAPYVVPLKAPPQFSSLAFGGYSTATVVQGRVSGYKAGGLLYGDVVIWGDRGPCWRGVVESTDRDGTLHCIGPNQVMGFHDFDAAPAAAKSFKTELLPASLITTELVEEIPWLVDATDGAAYWALNNLTLANNITITDRIFSDYMAAVMKYDVWTYGWYFEQIAGTWKCLPHYDPSRDVWLTGSVYVQGNVVVNAGVPYKCLAGHTAGTFATDLSAGKWEVTQPVDYIVTLSAEDAATFMGDSLQNLRSEVITTYGTNNAVNMTYDTDASHYLVQIGREKCEYVTSANTQSAGDADQLAKASLAKNASTKAGKTKIAKLTKASDARQLSLVQSNARLNLSTRRGTGSEKTSRIQRANGLPAYLPNIRPGTLARIVGLPTGSIDMRIVGTTCVGEHSISLDLGADSGRLDSLLARVS